MRFIGTSNFKIDDEIKTVVLGIFFSKGECRNAIRIASRYPGHAGSTIEVYN